MNREFCRFRVGSFECTCLADGEREFTLSEMFENTPADEVRRCLREKGWRDDIVVTPFTYLRVGDPLNGDDDFNLPRFRASGGWPEWERASTGCR